MYFANSAPNPQFVVVIDADWTTHKTHQELKKLPKDTADNHDM
jgi:hypothetical protein